MYYLRKIWTYTLEVRIPWCVELSAKFLSGKKKKKLKGDQALMLHYNVLEKVLI